VTIEEQPPRSHRRNELKNATATTPEKLHELLDALGHQLAFAGYPLHIVVIGGSGLSEIGAIVRATRDVDVVALHRDGLLVSA
jgi:hypothetical protein